MRRLMENWKLLVVFVAVGLMTLAIPSVLATSEPLDKVDTPERLVTIFDRGRKTVILTSKMTVGETLEQAAIEVSDSDVVEPNLNTELSSDKFNVNIFRSRPVMFVDGSSRVRVVTSHHEPDLVAKAAGITLYPEDDVATQINFMATGGEAGLHYVVTRAKLVNFVYYGKLTQVRTQGRQVGDLLKEKDLQLGEDDHLSLSPDAPISDGMTLELWREGRQELVQEEEVAFPVRKIYDYNREPTYHQIEKAGTKGRRLVTYEIEIKNGIEVARHELSSLSISNPIEQVEIVGARGRYNTPVENENITWDFLINQGFSRVQTAGIMGNLMQEHRFRTDGDGIAQWTGGRKAKLKSMYPGSHDTIYAQLEFLMFELNGSYAGVKNSILATDDLREATRIFQDKFEKCNPTYCMFEQRVRYAADILASH